jgi:hypothetical protein
MLPKRFLPFTVLLGCVLAACSTVPDTKTHYDPASLRFSGEQALATEAEFVEQFPDRHSGAPNNQRAAEWLRDRFTSYGLDCALDEWEIVNYSQPVPLRNVVCELAGESPQQILIVAHHDQSPDTIQGADNDGSGMAILLQLAEIFASEPRPRYSLVFVSSDAEEYGMIGCKRYVDTHPDTSRIVAGISLDNLGKEFYNGMEMSPIGQFRNYGPIWLLLSAREAARASGDLWVPRIRSPLDQVLNQAVPVSFMDQGPMVAAGIPALGFAGLYDSQFSDLHWETYHSPEDTLAYQSADTLYQSGRIAEALVRELLAMEKIPRESGPYLYFDGNRQVLRGAPLWAIFVGFVGLFFVGSCFKGGRLSTDKLAAWRAGLPHYLGLWLPLVAAIVLLYVFVAVGLMDKYHLYPATSKDEPLFEPRWLAVILFVVGLAVFLGLGRRLAARYGAQRCPEPVEGLAELSPGQINSFGLFVTGLAGLYILAINPFSLLFLVPTLFWFLSGGRRGLGKAFDMVLFALGGLIVYALFYFFGFVILRNNLAVLWYLMMMFSIGTISFPTAVAIMAIVAAGLSMVVNPPRGV